VQKFHRVNVSKVSKTEWSHNKCHWSATNKQTHRPKNGKQRLYCTHHAPCTHYYHIISWQSTEWVMHLWKYTVQSLRFLYQWKQQWIAYSLLT